MIVLGDETKTARALAAEILRRVDVQKAYADLLLDQALRSQSLKDADRALLNELVYGTLRWRGKIDALLSPHLSRPLKKTDPLIRNLLRLTIYQISFLEKIPDYAAVNEAVSLAKSRGAKAAGFANAVLRSFVREKNCVINLDDRSGSVEALAVAYSHPGWLVKKWLDQFGLAEAKLLMQANNQKAPLVLRVNSMKISRAELLELLTKAGMRAKPSEHSPQGIRLESTGAVERLPGFNEGFFQVQGESAQLVSYLLAPSPGERILDACAAPGGKSTHIAELMKDHGELIAIVTVLHDRTEEVERARLFDELQQAAALLEQRVRDATAELARQNELLRRQHMELEQASALKSQFLANMSHEFRTPLNAILGYTKMLLQGVYGELATHQRRNLARVDSNAHHLLAIIDNILDISKIEAGKMTLHVSGVALD